VRPSFTLNQFHTKHITLSDKMQGLYLLGKKTKKGDDLFMEILSKASPKTGSAYQNAVIVVMAKYFEVCDIFEEPSK